MPFTIERNDLAAVEADAIVVAANERLEITGGVGAAVARAAGFEQLQAACAKCWRELGIDGIPRVYRIAVA